MWELLRFIWDWEGSGNGAESGQQASQSITGNYIYTLYNMETQYPLLHLGSNVKQCSYPNSIHYVSCRPAAISKKKRNPVNFNCCVMQGKYSNIIIRDLLL